MRAIGARPQQAVPVRVAKHIERLGLTDLADYLAWCRARGLRPSIQKSWSELEAEWCVHGRELAVARARLRVDRDPRKLIAGVCAGNIAASDIARPSWRSLAERIERAGLARAAGDALRALVELVQRRGNLLLAQAAIGDASYPFLDGLIALCRRRDAWIRSPGDWRARSHNARRQFTSLARHLTARYPVPGFLDGAWLRADADAERWRDWFLRIGAGESLRSADAPIALTKRILHHFLRAPEHYAIEHALRWGQVHALGGDRRLVEALLATRIGVRFDHEDFWQSVIRFFVANPELDRAHVGPIVDYLENQRFAAQDVFVARGVRAQLPPPQPNLSMSGRSAESLLRQVERWHRALGRSAEDPGQRWERCGIGELELETGVRGDNLRVWRIRQLLSAEELRHEGSVMRHCVASYAHRCAKGGSTIWTLELWSFEGVQKCVTVEVDQGNRAIVQCRGRSNAPATPKQREILERWAEREGLRVGQFVWGA
jgi:hypothetical protein